MDIISVLVITFLLLPVIFLVLFIVFLNQSIRRGKRIKELEKEISILRQGNPGQTVPDAYATYAVPQNPMPQQNPVPQQNSVPQQGMMPGYAQPQYISLPEIQPQGYIQPPVQTAAPVPQTQNEIPGQAPAPSWALSVRSAAKLQSF